MVNYALPMKLDHIRTIYTRGLITGKEAINAIFDDMASTGYGCKATTSAWRLIKDIAKDREMNW